MFLTDDLLVFKPNPCGTVSCTKCRCYLPQVCRRRRGELDKAMVSDGVISCAYRLFGRVPPEAHSDLPMMFHETVTVTCSDTKVNFVVIILCISIQITISVRLIVSVLII